MFNRLDVAIRIRDVSAPEHQKFPTWAAAHGAYTTAYNLRVLQSVLIVGSEFAKKFHN